jgi:hypothetical protein
MTTNPEAVFRVRNWSRSNDLGFLGGNFLYSGTLWSRTKVSVVTEAPAVRNKITRLLLPSL